METIDALDSRSKECIGGFKGSLDSFLNSWLFMSRPGFTDSRFFVKTITLDLEVLYLDLSLVDSSQASSVIIWRSVTVSASRAISSAHVGAPTEMDPIVFTTPDRSSLFRNGFPLPLNRMVELSPPCRIPWPSWNV